MNLGQLRTQLQALGYGSDTAAAQTALLNTAYREITGSDRWPFLEKQNSSLTMTAGTGVYTYTGTITDLAEFDGVRLGLASDLTQYIPIENIEPERMRDYEMLDRVTQDQPLYWSIIANQLHFWPLPDKAYTIFVDYIYQPTDLSSDSDVPVLPVQFHDVLIFGAVKLMAQRERDIYSYNAWDSEYQRRTTKMRQAYLLRQRQTSSKVTESGMWDDSRGKYPYSYW